PSGRGPRARSAVAIAAPCRVPPQGRTARATCPTPPWPCPTRAITLPFTRAARSLSRAQSRRRRETEDEPKPLALGGGTHPGAGPAPALERTRKVGSDESVAQQGHADRERGRGAGDPADRFGDEAGEGLARDEPHVHGPERAAAGED